MQEYISNQAEILDTLITNIYHKSKVSIIKGVSGCGKSFLLNELKGNIRSVKFFHLEGDFDFRSSAYHPFRIFLDQRYRLDSKRLNRQIFTEISKRLAGELGSLSPIGSKLISNGIEELTAINKRKKELRNNRFKKDEYDLLFPLDYFCRSDKTTVFLLDDLQYWDKDSLQMVYSLINNEVVSKHDFLHNTVFVATVTTDQEFETDIINTRNEQI